MDARKLGISLIALCPLVVAAQQVDDPVTEFESLLRETRGLELYNSLRARQINQQEQDLANLQASIEGVPELALSLPPLLIRMVDGLREFIQLDMPLLTEERTNRVDGLYALIEDKDLNDAVKLRRIFEAWSIEVEYGAAFRSFPGKLPIGNTDRDANFVAIGRVGLFFQTPDEDAIVTGAWDYRSSQWVELGSDYRNPVRQAIRMAQKQIAPEFVMLPMVPPQPE